ncbi:MAG: DUF188 domain-containing protein [Treponema sp.]|jgi:uncharacterized protein YaiI (UPF0178 family)|nr:DUF188 domain-containing protein [Treponema sp.]
MKIFVDADSCPRLTREAVLRAAARTGIQAIFAANRPIPAVSGATAVMEQCPPGEDSADNRIVELARPGDLVITRDIPLASRLVEASIMVLDDRGRTYTTENIRERLSLRNFILGLAEQGGGNTRNPHYGKRELKRFADSFDRMLSHLMREAAQAPGYHPPSSG